jgi:type IV secretory pathway VirB10-like protein
MSATERVVGRGPGPKGDIDEPFRRSMASLSDQLAARPVEPPPRFDADDRMQSDQADRIERREGRSAVWAVGFTLGAIAGACLIYSFIDASFFDKAQSAGAPPPAATTAKAPPSPPPPAATSAPAPAPPVQERVERQVPAPPSAPPVNLQPQAPPSEPEKLEAYEVMEVQTRLKALGVEPHMLLDGLPGRQTKAAIQRYEESRGQPPTGNVNRALLNRLRQEAKAP